MVTAMDKYTGHEFAELFREDDRQRAANAAFLAERKAAKEAQARKSGEDGLVDRGNEQTAQDGSPASLPAASSDDDGGILGSVEHVERLSRALGRIMADLKAEMRDEWRRDIAALHRRTVACRRDIDKLREQIDSDTQNGIEVYCNAFDRRLALLEAENIELKGMLGSALQRLGAKSADGVIDLPNWRRRHA